MGEDKEREGVERKTEREIEREREREMNTPFLWGKTRRGSAISLLA